MRNTFSMANSLVPDEVVLVVKSAAGGVCADDAAANLAAVAASAAAAAGSSPGDGPSTPVTDGIVAASWDTSSDAWCKICSGVVAVGVPSKGVPRPSPAPALERDAAEVSKGADEPADIVRVSHDGLGGSDLNERNAEGRCGERFSGEVVSGEAK